MLAMLYLIIFAALAVGFYSAVTMASQVAHNDEKVMAAQVAAESGLRFIQMELARVKIPGNTPHNQMLQEVLNDLSTRFFGYELIRDLPHAAQFRFDLMADEHRKMVKLILEGSDREIEAGFKKAFAGFLEYVLVRFSEKPPARRAAE